MLRSIGKQSGESVESVLCLHCDTGAEAERLTLYKCVGRGRRWWRTDDAEYR